MAKSYFLRRPRFRIEAINDSNAISFDYDARANASNDELLSRGIQFQTKNAMSDDSAVFQIVLYGDVQWDKVLQANDIIKIYVKEDETIVDSNEQLVLNGMVSQVSNMGEHGNDKSVYKITGQSFSKPFLNFGLGIIQEVSAVMSSSIGWLPDDKEHGIEFTGKTAKEVMQSALDRFLKYMKYNYPTNKEETINQSNVDRTLRDNFDWTLDSWTEYENLQDHTNLINFDGNFKQMLDLITCKPFNELFFRNGKNNKAELVLRRTPFDPSDWRNLEIVHEDTLRLISEDVGKSDVESYAVFNVTTPQQTKELKSELLSKPQTHRALRNRYGYKKLEAEYMFLPITDSDENSDENDTQDNEDKGNVEVTYDQLYNDLSDLGQDRVSKDKDGVISRLASKYRGVDKKQAKKLAEKYIKTGNVTGDYFEEVTGVDPNKKVTEDAINKFPSAKEVKEFVDEKYPQDKFSEDFKKDSDYKKLTKALKKEYPKIKSTHIQQLTAKFKDKKGKLTDKDYKDFVNKAKERARNAQETGAAAGDNAFSIFSKKLFNWYHANQNFTSGSLTVVGSGDYDLGKRLIMHNKQTNERWEYYIESVEHNFDMEQGYTTTLGVTRGLRMEPRDSNEAGSSYRFAFLWGQSSDFLGGYLGEKSLLDLKKEGVESKKKKDDGEGGEGHSGGSLEGLKKYKGKLPTPRNKKDTNWTASGNPNTGQWARECTWYAYNRRSELDLPLPNGWGDAADWVGHAKSSGMKTGKTPKQGALAIWQRGAPGGSAQYGHVAFVEKVLDDGKGFHLSEYNYEVRKGYSERDIQMSSPEGKNVTFIYD